MSEWLVKFNVTIEYEALVEAETAADARREVEESKFSLEDDEEGSVAKVEVTHVMEKEVQI